jgi:hypothetical protein
MRRLIVIAGVVAAGAAAVGAALRRRRSAPAPVAAAPPPPAPAPAPTPAPTPAAAHEPDSPPPSVVSPAAETVKAVPATPAEAIPEPPADEELERAVEAELSADPVAEEADVSVAVNDRIASLEGTVPDEQAALRIGDEAAHVDGVQGVDNRLRPAPSPVQEGAEQDDDG